MNFEHELKNHSIKFFSLESMVFTFECNEMSTSAYKNILIYTWKIGAYKVAKA